MAPHLSVEANITLGRESASFGTLRGQADKVREILAGLGHGDLDPRLPAGRLGVAERQIVEIARALYLDARLLLMDEPTSALPGRDVDRLFQAMGAQGFRG